MTDHQCPSCGGFCNPSGCERENVKLVHQPQSVRPWVGLTDEEIDTWPIVGHESLRDFIRAIEAKLKEKNNATTQPLSRDEVAARVFNEHFNKEKNT